MNPLIQELEGLIRNSQLDEARERLGKLDVTTIARPDLAPLAGIARRAGLPEISLRLLNPVVRPVHPLKVPASVQELAIYAASLARIGAYEEAMEIFKGLRKDATPEVLLFEAFTQIHQWNYAEAVPRLRKYLDSSSITPYESVIGKINLAACFQYLGTFAKEKDDLLNEILSSSEENSWTRPQAMAMELCAQSAISRADYSAAAGFLEKLAALSPADTLLLEKWRAILSVKKNAADLSPLRMLRTKAATAQAQEILRECDFYEGVEGRDAPLAMKVYFGSPAPSYRKRLKALTKDWLKLPDDYVWNESERVLNLLDGKEDGRSLGLKPGQAVLRLLQILSSDFYRSFPLGSLFAFLYPGEVFNVDSSPSRVRRVVDRLREWFVEQNVPMQVELKGGQFRLLFTAPYGLRLPKNVLELDSGDLNESRLSRLREKYGPRGFSSRDAADHLEISVENARKLLKDAVDKKKLRCTGRGRATEFRFAR